MKLISFQYRKVFDKNVVSNWDKAIRDDTFMEYKMKSQFYDEKVEFPMFRDLLIAKPEAVKLHYLVSLSAIGHIQFLRNLFPEVVDTLGSRCIPFQNYTFEILNSDFYNIDKHVVQLDFFSEPLCLIEVIGETFWLAKPQDNQERIETFMVNKSPNLMINSLVL
jgi:hypothetical protein